MSRQSFYPCIQFRTIAVRSLETSVKEVLSRLEAEPRMQSPFFNLGTLPEDIRKARKPADILHISVEEGDEATAYITSLSYLREQEPQTKLLDLDAGKEGFYLVPPSWK